MPVFAPSSLAATAAVTSLVGGVALHAVAAQAMSRHGLANGWLVLAAYGTLRTLHISHEPTLLGFLLLGAAVAIGLTARRAGPPDARRLPVSGLVPATLVPALVFVLSLSYLPSDFAVERLTVLRFLEKDALQLGIAAGAAVLLSLGRGTPSPVAMLTAIGLCVGISALPLLVPALALASPLIGGAVAGVAVAELVDGVRRRLLAPDTVVLVAHHDVERADDAIDRLRAAGIPASSTGARARGLYRGLGGFVPVTLHVPADRADEARALLRLPPETARPSPPSAATGE